MARPKSDDPKVPVPIRLRRSLAVLIQDGEGWRDRLEAVIAAAYAPSELTRAAKAAPVPSPAIHVSVPVFERKAFNPRPKTGNPK